jgi:formylglycine-generating enzyme required for sulfatase activity
VDDIEESGEIHDNVPRVQLGGSWGSQPADVRAAFRSWNGPAFRHAAVGFRPARTIE